MLGFKTRVGGNHGNGKKFKPGKNSQDGTVFRRGPDDIPRGSVSLMYRTVLADAREQLYRNLCELTKTPRGALAFAEAAGDRLEGRSVQKHEIAPARETYFGPAPENVDGPGHAGRRGPVNRAGQRPRAALTGANGQTLRPVF